MGIGSSHATSRFRLLIIFFIFLTLVSGFVFSTKEVLAAQWFTVYGAGVLSGKTSDAGIVNNSIPSTSLPSGFYSNTIQTESNTPVIQSTDGILLSSADQDVSSSDDPYIKNLQLTKFGNSIGITIPTTFTCGSSCPSPDFCNFLSTTSPLDPAKVYVTTVTCFETALFSSGGTYNLTADGMAVLFVQKEESNNILTINKNLRTFINNNKRRILVITDAQVEVTASVSHLENPLSKVARADVELGIITTNTESNSFEVTGSPTATVVLEGPIIAAGNVMLSRNASGSNPGVYVKYNPIYLIEMTRKAAAGLTLSNVSGLFTGKEVWSYE